MLQVSGITYICTNAGVLSVTSIGTHATILAGGRRAEINFDLTVSSHEPCFTITTIVVDKLDTILRSWSITGIRQALVDVALTTGANVSGRTLTFKFAHFVDAGPIVMTSTFETIVLVVLTKNTLCAMRT